MASPRKPPPRRLSEVLEEDQEPFFLDADAYPERTVPSRAALFVCWRLNERRSRGRRGGAWRCLPGKLGCWEVVRRALNWIDRAPRYRRLGLSHCLRHARDIAGKECQLSPVSVLDLCSDEDSSVQNHLSPVEMVEENQSISGLDSHVEDGAIRFSFPPAASRERNGDKMDETTWSWESQWGDLALVDNLISLDFQESRKDWSQFQDQRSEVVVQIGGLILEELREECVLDMLG